MKKNIRKNKSLKKDEKSSVIFEVIEKKILILRGKKIMLDRDLAELYKVPTRTLNQAVKRNADRFPEDFMFSLSKEEAQWWRSQIVISTALRKGVRYVPIAFTEQGIAMLSSVLRSKRAISVNVQIMRTFIRLREYMRDNSDIRRKLETLERRYDDQFQVVFDAIKKILQYEADDTKRIIGFTHDEK
jgi:ORF6N domain